MLMHHANDVHGPCWLSVPNTENAIAVTKLDALAAPINCSQLKRWTPQSNTAASARIGNGRSKINHHTPATRIF